MATAKLTKPQAKAAARRAAINENAALDVAFNNSLKRATREMAKVRARLVGKKR